MFCFALHLTKTKNNTASNQTMIGISRKKIINFRTDPRNLTDIRINYSSAPVRIERKQVLDQWKDSLRPLETIYYAKVIVKYDTNYIFRVSTSDHMKY